MCCGPQNRRQSQTPGLLPPSVRVFTHAINTKVPLFAWNLSPQVDLGIESRFVGVLCTRSKFPEGKNTMRFFNSNKSLQTFSRSLDHWSAQSPPSRQGSDTFGGMSRISSSSYLKLYLCVNVCILYNSKTNLSSVMQFWTLVT